MTLALFFGCSGGPADAPPEPVEASLPPLPAADISPLPEDELLHQVTLDNGLRLLARPVAEAEEVHVLLIVEAGVDHEQPDELGLAHLVEHLTFQDNAWLGARPYDRIRENGWLLGSHGNAVTSDTHTVYGFEVPPDQLDEGLDLLRAAAADARMLPEAVDHEKKIVLREYQERSRQVHPEVVAALQGFDAAQARTFYDRWYRPDRMTLVVVGAIDPEAVDVAARQRFDMPPASRPAPPPVVAKGQEAEEAPVPGAPEGWLAVAGFDELPPELRAYARVQASSDVVFGEPTEDQAVSAMRAIAIEVLRAPMVEAGCQEARFEHHVVFSEVTASEHGRCLGTLAELARGGVDAARVEVARGRLLSPEEDPMLADPVPSRVRAAALVAEAKATPGRRVVDPVARARRRAELVRRIPVERVQSTVREALAEPPRTQVDGDLPEAELRPLFEARWADGLAQEGSGAEAPTQGSLVEAQDTPHGVRWRLGNGAVVDYRAIEGQDFGIALVERRAPPRRERGWKEAQQSVETAVRGAVQSAVVVPMRGPLQGLLITCAPEDQEAVFQVLGPALAQARPFGAPEQVRWLIQSPSRRQTEPLTVQWIGGIPRGEPREVEVAPQADAPAPRGRVRVMGPLVSADVVTDLAPLEYGEAHVLGLVLRTAVLDRLRHELALAYSVQYRIVVGSRADQGRWMVILDVQTGGADPAPIAQAVVGALEDLAREGLPADLVRTSAKTLDDAHRMWFARAAWVFMADPTEEGALSLPTNQAVSADPEALRMRLDASLPAEVPLEKPAGR